MERRQVVFMPETIKVDALVASTARLARGDHWRCTPAEMVPQMPLPTWTNVGHIDLCLNVIGRLREVQWAGHKLAMQV